MAVAKTVSAITTISTVAVVGISLRLGLGLSSGEGRKGKCQDLREKISLAGISWEEREGNAYSLHLSSATVCDKPCSSKSIVAFYTQPTNRPTVPSPPPTTAFTAKQEKMSMHLWRAAANLVP